MTDFTKIHIAYLSAVKRFIIKLELIVATDHFNNSGIVAIDDTSMPFQSSPVYVKHQLEETIN